MADNEKLSQSEIDALIGAFKEGDTKTVEEFSKKDKLRQYDFDRPEKFSVDNIRSIELMSNNFAKGCSQLLTQKMRQPLVVEFSSIEQIPFREYTGSVGKDYYGFCVADLGHEKLQEIVIEVDLSFVMVLHKRWLGSDFAKELSPPKPLTDIEKITLSKLLRQVVFETLEESWSSIAQIRPKYVNYQTDPQLLKVTSTNDMMALVTFDISGGEWQTTLRLCIPFTSVEEMIDKFTSENIRESQPNKKKKTFRKEIEKGLEKVEEEIHVSIGETVMALDEVAMIEEGDILRLNSKISEPSKGYAAGVHKFFCQLGRNRNNKAFKFVEIFKDAEQEEEVQEYLKEKQRIEDREKETEKVLENLTNEYPLYKGE